jgi:glycosyltransferase involved in cell wall biosynthesis
MAQASMTPVKSQSGSLSSRDWTVDPSTASFRNEPIQARGKFLFAGREKFFVRGVSYGAFRPNDKKEEYFDRGQLHRDFEAMAEAGFNTVRIPHTTPPVHLLDIAHQHGLRVMVGLSAEQYAGFLIDRDKAPNLPRLVQERARKVAGHPALCCYCLGNEIPASLARWIGRKPIEAYLRELYFAVKQVDPQRMVTYVNYPTTEYLHLPFLDMLCFNVYLERKDQLSAYLARLQNLAGDRPLVMSEIGLDAYRNGVDKQAEVLEWQIETVFEEGGAGVVVFSWTDEWFRGGAEVGDWEFGVTDRERRPKKSLAAVSRTFERVPFSKDRVCPLISVVLCSYNGSRTIGQSLEHLGQLAYPNYEVIVVDDGSTDNTAEIAARFPVRLIRTENRGLSSARNTGWQAAAGEIVAYIDDDAYPDCHWLDYLALTFEQGGYAAVGGPNLAPEADGWTAQCIACAPGGPTHVLLTDRLAEHIPGCNMAFRRSVLRDLSGFDEQFRVAGDDVDICWRVLDSGQSIGFSPVAVVWHHRRPSMRTFWRQQKGYGKAEALLHRKWPQKFNRAYHTRWSGRVYRAGLNIVPGVHPVIYYGVWGEAPYQKLEGRPLAPWRFLPLMPEWYLVNGALALLSILGLAWHPLLLAIVPLVFSALWPMWYVIAQVRHVHFTPVPVYWRRVQLSVLLVALNALQPLARLWGRLRHGLAPWKNRGAVGFLWPRRRAIALFETTWLEPHLRLKRAETQLQATGGLVFRSGPYDRWDLELVSGLWGGARVQMAVEDQGSGTQYVRYAVWPRLSPTAIMVACALAALGILAASDRHMIPAALLLGASAVLGAKIIHQSGAAMAAALGAVRGASEQ